MIPTQSVATDTEAINILAHTRFRYNVRRVFSQVWFEVLAGINVSSVLDDVWLTIMELDKEVES